MSSKKDNKNNMLTLSSHSHRILLTIVCLLCTLHTSCSFQASRKDKHSIVVLVGATGDLASKYLWQALFNVYSKSLDDVNGIDKTGSGRFANQSFTFIGAARKPEEQGMVILNNILSTIVCNDGKFGKEKTDRDCEKRKETFTTGVNYLQLSDIQDFEKLCAYVVVKFMNVEDNTKELIFYLSVSPSAYELVLQKFKRVCGLQLRDMRIDVKWSLEKPFGVDKQSADLLSEKVLKYTKESEIYRVDHYLGKSLMKTILPFRYANPELELLINKDHVDRVEIFLKETVDVKDRISFYNEMGVLRDIHQSHLTELLILVAMYLPSNIQDSQEISDNKGSLLRQVKSVRSQGALFGQYADYIKHVTNQQPNNTNAKFVPTFAAALVKINSPRWQGVPFILVSGKQLDKRESYIRIIFKNKHVCISHCHEQQNNRDSQEHQQQLIFHIGHGDLSRPAILVSKSLGKPKWPENILDFSDPSLFKTSYVHGAKNSHFYAGAIIDDVPAYQTVFSDLIDGRKESFVNTRNLLLSWHIWDHIVATEKSPRIYSQGDESKTLNFMITDKRLTFADNIFISDVEEDSGHGEFISKSDSQLPAHTVAAHTPAFYLGRKLISGKLNLVALTIAKSIRQAAEAEIKRKGSFHIAFPGGRSVTPVFQLLAQSFHNVQWQSIHVWQVDERCVPHHDNLSNFESLDRELLRFVDIPFANVHAMPVDVGGDICDDRFGGAHAYSESIKHMVPNSQLDLVILGLGSDGHVASLFPESTALHVDSDTFVTMSDQGPKETPKRMTLTLPIINNAKQIIIMAFGKGKSAIIRELEKSKSVETHPVLGVSPVNGTLTWYIDDDAFDVPIVE